MAMKELRLDVDVSIHAPRCRGAMPIDRRIDTGISQFQSTPPVAGERCVRSGDRLEFDNSFQSTPPVAGERCCTRW